MDLATFSKEVLIARLWVARKAAEMSKRVPLFVNLPLERALFLSVLCTVKIVKTFLSLNSEVPYQPKKQSSALSNLTQQVAL